MKLSDTWVAHGIRSRAAADRICGHIRAAFAGQDVARSEYEHLIATMPGEDLDDHLHAAAAVARTPTTIITENVRDFPPAHLEALGVSVRRPDDYLVELFDNHAKEIARIVVEMAADRRRPPMTPGDILQSLSGAGVTGFVERLREYLDV